MVTIAGDLFGDIMIEILSRLPVKSLIRFRCICKSWYTLTKNPTFITKHLKDDEKTRLVIFYIIDDDGTDEFYYPRDLFGLFPDATLIDTSVQDLDPYQPARGMIGGPYDGVFCIFGINNRITLWNLATKESRTLPKCRAIFPCYKKISCTNVGFGLDLVSDYYKLVLIFTLWDEKRNFLYEFSHVAVYTLDTDSWRDFESFKSIQYHMPQSFDSTYLNGHCYWLLDLVDSDHKMILSFNMQREVFQEIQGPHNIAESAHATLGLYDDSLALLYLNMTNNCFEIWIIKESNWIKQLTTLPPIPVNKPLGLWKKGTIFIESSTQELLLYDPSTQEIRDLKLRSSWFCVYNYNESLIPIKGDDKMFDIPWHVLGL